MEPERNAEVGEVGVSLLIEEHIGGFDVAVDHTSAMSSSECWPDLGEQRLRVGQAQRTVITTILKGAAPHPSHDEECAARVTPVVI